MFKKDELPDLEVKIYKSYKNGYFIYYYTVLSMFDYDLLNNINKNINEGFVVYVTNRTRDILRMFVEPIEKSDRNVVINLKTLNKGLKIVYHLLLEEIQDSDFVEYMRYPDTKAVYYNTVLARIFRSKYKDLESLYQSYDKHKKNRVFFDEFIRYKSIPFPVSKEDIKKNKLALSEIKKRSLEKKENDRNEFIMENVNAFIFGSSIIILNIFFLLTLLNLNLLEIVEMIFSGGLFSLVLWNLTRFFERILCLNYLYKESEIFIKSDHDNFFRNFFQNNYLKNKLFINEMDEKASPKKENENEEKNNNSENTLNKNSENANNNLAIQNV